MPFTVMTWNVENLFVPGQHGDALPQADFDAKLDLVAGTVQLLDPDVVAFQELGAQALGLLRQRLGAGTYAAARESVPDTRTIRVGILSKHAFVNETDLRDFPAEVPDISDENDNPIPRMGRGAPHVEIQFQGTNIHLISTHLKSKLLTFPGGVFSTNDETLRAQIGAIALNKRTAEATTIRLAVNQVLANNPGHAVVVLGDLNDGPSAATSQLLLGPSGSEIGTMGFSRPDQGDAQRLFNTAPAIPADRRFSRIHRGVGELLDQILASEEMFPRASANDPRQVPVADSHIDFADGLPSVGTNPNVRLGEIIPDHSPVTATFPI